MKQSDKYLIINSLNPIKNEKIELKDLKSRLDSFLDIGIGLPTDDLVKSNYLVKSFSDKQINVRYKIIRVYLEKY